MPGLVECVRRCYGDTYGEPGFYDAAWLVRQQRSGRLLSIGACAEGRVVGHLGMTVASRGDVVGDTVAAMVEPDYRGQGLVHRMGRVLYAAFQANGVVATRHLATGTHLRTQRPLVDSGAIPTGVLLAHVQAGTQFRGVGHRFGDRRIGVVAYFQRYGDLGGLDVYLPVRYATMLTELYERAGLVRHSDSRTGATTTARRGAPTAAVTTQRNARASVVVVRIAATLDARISTDELAYELESRPEVSYVDVPLPHPDCPATVEWLRREGFAFGALLPGTIDSEFLRMQNLPADRAKPDAIECATAEGARLRDWIAAELAGSPARRGP
jgi:hypothetical protein